MIFSITLSHRRGFLWKLAVSILFTTSINDIVKNRTCTKKGLACSNRTSYTRSVMASPIIRKQVTIRFLHRTVLFLFTVLIALFVLFVLGNIQNFLDASQIIILQFLSGTGILLFLCAAFAFLFEINYSIHLRKLYYLGHCILSGIACIFGLLTAIASSVIISLSNGLNQI